MTTYTMSDTTPKARVIAALLAQAIHYFPEDAPEGMRVTFKFGTLTIRCHASAGAVRVVSEKYRKGFNRHSAADKLSKPSLRRPANADALLAALADPEPALEPVQEAA